MLICPGYEIHDTIASSNDVSGVLLMGFFSAILRFTFCFVLFFQTFAEIGALGALFIFSLDE